VFFIFDPTCVGYTWNEKHLEYLHQEES
jgi:hypothetical protein